MTSVNAKIEEILEAIKALRAFAEEIRSERTQPTDQEAIAAKIIKDIKDDAEQNNQKVIDKISECPCNQEILDALGQKKKDGKEIVIPSKESTGKTSEWNPKYKFPNWNVGNQELGSSKNPNSKEWPFK